MSASLSANHIICQMLGNFRCSKGTFDEASLTFRLTFCLDPPLSCKHTSLFLSNVQVATREAAQTMSLTAPQTPAAHAGPARSPSSAAARSAAGLWGLLRVAAAELPDLACSGVNADSLDCSGLNQLAAGSRAGQTLNPAYADGHGAALMAGAWAAPRLLPTAAAASRNITAVQGGAGGVFGSSSRGAHA